LEKLDPAEGEHDGDTGEKCQNDEDCFLHELE
jgi:hypothetical protein